MIYLTILLVLPFGAAAYALAGLINEREEGKEC